MASAGCAPGRVEDNSDAGSSALRDGGFNVDDAGTDPPTDAGTVDAGQPGPLTLSAVVASNVTQTEATVTVEIGGLIPAGAKALLQVTADLTTGPWIESDRPTAEPGAFSYTFGGLIPGTTYSARAFVFTDNGGVNDVIHAQTSTTNFSTTSVVSTVQRIMFMGDSLTAGDDSVEGRFRTYRGRALADLAAAGLVVDAIGTQSRPPAIGGDPDCEGYGGAFISHPVDANNLLGRLPAMMAAAGPLDLVVLMVGWNDVYNQPARTAERYTELFDACFVVCTLTPQRGESEAQTAAGYAAYAAVNSRVRQTAATQAGVTLADCASLSFVDSDYWDVIHWLQPGADKVGSRIAQAVVAALGS